jgi:hypothetical protein
MMVTWVFLQYYSDALSPALELSFPSSELSLFASANLHPVNTSVVQKALNMGNWGSMILTAIASYFLVRLYFTEGSLYIRGFEFTRNQVLVPLLWD